MLIRRAFSAFVPQRERLFCQILRDEELHGLDADADGGARVLTHVLVETGSLALLIPDNMEAGTAAAAQRICHDEQRGGLHLTCQNTEALPGFPFLQQLIGDGHLRRAVLAVECVLCLQLLAAQGVEIFAHIAQIGSIPDRAFDPLAPERPGSGFPVLDAAAGAAMRAEIAAAAAVGDSVGGVVECAVTGLPAGVGAPMFGGMENRLAQALFASPAVKGVEFGSGFAGAALRGSENNDPYYMENGAVRTRTNHAGGILGGLSTGMPIVFRAAFKPTPSIALPQQTVRLSDGAPVTLELRGRHDPCIVPRAVPCVEAAAALAVLDAALEARIWKL